MLEARGYDQSSFMSRLPRFLKNQPHSSTVVEIQLPEDEVANLKQSLDLMINYDYKNVTFIND